MTHRRLYLKGPTVRTNETLRSKQERYRKELEHHRLLETLAAACQEGLRMLKDEERFKQEREERVKQEKEQRLERERKRRERFDKTSMYARERKKSLELLRKRQVRQGNIRDLRRYLKRNGRSDNKTTDYSALDDETRMTFYRRRKTNNSASTVCDVISREKWGNVPEGSQHGKLSDFIVC